MNEATVTGRIHASRRIAIACEGGGSHTAFTAGVLGRLLREPLKIVALSGTSGGAVCAMLAWRGLLAGDREDGRRRLEAFWRENKARGLEAVRDAFLLMGLRLVGEAFSPESSPYRRLELEDADRRFKAMLERHCGFAELPQLLAANPAAPRLLIGACEVKSGEFTAFRSHPVTHRGVRWPASEFDADVILASCAVPTLFRAVHLGECDYWDGVFAQNPPIRELPDLVRTLPGEPGLDEIWVVRINPRIRASVPRSMADIRDRRNELAGIISLSQELYLIDLINRLIQEGKLVDTKHTPIVLRSIEMEDRHAARLDFESKLDRSAAFLEELERHGAEQADAFLRNPDDHLEATAAVARVAAAQP